MNASVLSLVAAAFAGATLGGVYLALLWVAVRRLAQDGGCVAVFVALGLARMALLLGVLAVAAALGVSAAGLVAALFGFVAVRLAATRLSNRGTLGKAVWK